MCRGVKDKLKNTLKVFKRHQIEVLPINKVKQGNNSKKNFYPDKNHPWKNVNYSYEANIKAVDDGVVGFMVRSGIKSNIIVLDLDKKDTSYPQLLQKLLDMNTFYVKTPSGGYHFYFQYTPKIKCNKIGVFGNLDIRTEGGLLFLGVRDDGEYEINYEDAIIKKLPDDIIIEILNYKKPSKTLDYNLKKQATIDTLTFNNNDRYKNDVRYNITDEILYKYLYDLPNEYVEDYSKWMSITYILKFYGYRDVWDKWSKLSKNKYNVDENNSSWRSIKFDKNITDLNYIVQILNDTTYKDDPISPIKKIYKEYEILNSSNLKKIQKVINVKYLDKTLYEDGLDKIVSSQLKTGKSFSNVENAKHHKQLYFSIVSLTKTQESQYEAFLKAGIPSFSYKNIKDVKHFINEDDEISDKDDEISDKDVVEDFNKKAVGINLNNKCIFTTIDSLMLFEFQNINFSKYIVYLDEIHSLIQYLLKCQNLSKKRIEIFSFLIKILKECKQIIAVDGDICNNVIKLFDILGRRPYQFIQNVYQSYQGVKCFRITDENKMIEQMKEDIKNNKYFTVCCNTKKLADKIYEILKRNVDDPDKILRYTSKSGKTIKDINKEWRNRYVIYSPSIVMGLDFTPPEPINTYSFIDGNNTLNPEQIGQQICRNRNIKNVYLYMVNMTNTLKYKNLEDVKNYFKKNVISLKTHPSFYELSNRNYINGEVVYDDTIFNEMYYELEYQTDILTSSYEYNLYTILSKKGFIMVDEIHKNKNLQKDLQEIINDNLQLYENNMYDKFLNNELDIDDKYKVCLDKEIEILGIEKTDINNLIEFKDFIQDQHKFQVHLNIRYLLYNDEYLQNKHKEEFSTDYFIIQHKHIISIIKNYKNIMRKYLPEINLYNYEYNYDDEFLDNSISMSLEDFTYIKSVIRTTKNINLPTIKRQLVELMNLYTTSIFGKDIIKSKKINKKINKKTVSYYSREFKQDVFIQHMNLYKILLSRRKHNINHIDKTIVEKYFTEFTKYLDITDDDTDAETDNETGDDKNIVITVNKGMKCNICGAYNDGSEAVMKHSRLHSVSDRKILEEYKKVADDYSTVCLYNSDFYKQLVQ